MTGAVTEEASRAAPTTNAEQPFDAADWLDRFKESGGWWVVAESRLSVGWPVDDFSQALRLCKLFGEMDRDPENRAAVREYVLARTLDYLS